MANHQTTLDECVIEGINTIIPFQKQILMNEHFKSGNFDTNFLNKFKYTNEGEI